MRLVQFWGSKAERQVGLVRDDGQTIAVLHGTSYVRDLALEAHRSGIELAAAVQDRVGAESIDYNQLIARQGHIDIL